MRILCDTCSVLMVIRVAPDMFVDQRFGCATIPKVYDEIFRKQKFKTKYPWRDQFKTKIITLGNSELMDSLVGTHLSTIELLVETGVVNSKTGRLVDLSPTDKHIIACAAAKRYEISSGDNDLVCFAEHQFDIKNVSPLGLINDWMEAGLVSWGQNLQMIIEDWDKCSEAEQPITEVGRYQTITRQRYVGP